MVGVVLVVEEGQYSVHTLPHYGPLSISEQLFSLFVRWEMWII